MFDSIIDQHIGESLDALAVRIGMIDAPIRVRTGVRLYSAKNFAYTPPISAEVVLAIATMASIGIISSTVEYRRVP
jgi:hypothetical protein